MSCSPAACCPRAGFGFGFATGFGEAANASAIVVPAGSGPWAWMSWRTSGAVSRPTVAPSVTAPSLPQGTVWPAPSVTGEPSISRPVTDPLPSVASTLVAVTRPRKRETDASVTFALLQVEPLAVEDWKLATAPDAGWPEGPRLAAGVPYATVGRPGTEIARAPAPRQPPGR